MPQKLKGRSLFFLPRRALGIRWKRDDANKISWNSSSKGREASTPEAIIIGEIFFTFSSNNDFFFQENNFYAGSKEAYCQNVTCKPGRECRVLFSGIAECVCISRCPNKGRPICGSDGLRYRSHCELHRQACLKGRNLELIFKRIRSK